jgi:hypothetical protein
MADERREVLREIIKEEMEPLMESLATLIQEIQDLKQLVRNGKNTNK